MTTTDSILNTLREVSDYFKDRLDYDMRGDPPTYIGNEEAHLYGEVQEAMKELDRAGQRERALVEALEWYAGTGIQLAIAIEKTDYEQITRLANELGIDRGSKAKAALAAYGEKP